MTRKEEIRQEAHRKYPYVGGTKGMICENSIPIFIQGAEWADKTMIEKATQWLFENVYDYLNSEDQERVESFRKAMEE
jgi:hypothetical protein